MYLVDQKIDRIEGSEIVLENGKTIKLSEQAQKYLLTEKECTSEEYYTIIDKKIISELFEVIKNIDIQKILLNEREYAKELDQEFVNIASEVIKCMTEFDFPIERISVGFRFLKGMLDKINVLVTNNLTSIENMILVKALNLQDEGNSDEERIRSMRISHLIENIKNNS